MASPRAVGNPDYSLTLTLTPTLTLTLTPTLTLTLNPTLATAHSPLLGEKPCIIQFSHVLF